MFYNHKIAVVIPTFRAEKWIASATGDPRVLLLCHDKNKGVGGAMVTGFSKALELEADIIVKMDSDGQMNPDYLCALLYPLATKKGVGTATGKDSVFHLKNTNHP